MPELPEVEAVVRTLRPLVLGRQIRCVHVFHPIVTKPQLPHELVCFASGQRIIRVARHGKYLQLFLQRGLLTMHFRLDGQLLWFAGAKELQQRANASANGVHVDVALEFARGALGFADQRHFGRVHFWSIPAASAGLRVLGVDALDSAFTAASFAALLASSRRPLKDFLLEQKFVAGIGNIYSCEALWHARLHPRRATCSLTRREAVRLHKAIVSVLRRALECCLHPPPNFRDPEWWFQGLERILQVYDRAGEPCRRCSTAVARVAQSGRSTYYCKHCQR